MSGFKAKAREYRECFQDMIEKPFECTKAEVAAGTAQPSFTSTILEGSNNLTDEEIGLIKHTASSLYAGKPPNSTRGRAHWGTGAADTTVSVLYGFFLAMVFMTSTHAILPH